MTIFLTENFDLVNSEFTDSKHEGHLAAKVFTLQSTLGKHNQTKYTIR